MPDRIIRDELLRSPRYRTLSSDTARLLFLHLLLNVDNLGNFEAHHIAIGDVLRRALDAETAAKLLSELADADLIRLYQVAGKPYLHVPRFRQRLKYLGSKHPRPPSNIECSEISELVEKSGLQAAHSPPIGSLKAPEVKRSKPNKSTRARARQPRPQNFGISARVLAWAAENGHERLQEHLTYFIGKADANGYVYADWDQAFMNAIRENWAKLAPKEVPRLAL